MTPPADGIGGRIRIDFDEMVDVPLIDVDNGVYLDADRLPLSATSKERLRDLQRRWSEADERYFAGGALDEPIDDTFDADLKDVELRLRRELAGTPWSLSRSGRRKGSGKKRRR